MFSTIFNAALFVSISLSSMTGCFRQPIREAGGGSASDLSEISIQAPKDTDLRKEFGPLCEKVKLSAKLGPDQDQCPAVAKLLSHYRLTIRENICDVGTSGSLIERADALGSKALESEKVKKGCDYDLLLEVGSLTETGSMDIYFTNRSSSRKLVSKSSLATGRARVKVILEPTDLGISSGFPANSDISTEPPADNASNLSIDIAFGGKNQESEKPLQGSQGSQVPQSSQPEIPQKVLPQSPKNITALTGSYVSECRPIPFAVNQFDLVELKLAASTIEGRRVVSSDPRCMDPEKNIMTTLAMSEFSAKERPDLGRHAYEIELKLRSNLVELMTDQAVTSWNKQNACGVNSWAKNQPVDLIVKKSSEPACTSDLVTALRAFDIVRIDNRGDLQVGRKLRDAGDGMNYILGLSADERPKEWGRSFARSNSL